ncbi:MAG: carboxypeptidase-like regulatory domain-containing protein [Phycisphaerae bacterium]|jgi:hypothetical protein
MTRLLILTMGVASLFAAGVPATAEPSGSTLVVHLQRAADGTPVPGVTVLVGEQRATSDFTGVARFPYLEQAPTDIAVHDLGFHFVDRALAAEEQQSGLVTVQLEPMTWAEVTIHTAVAEVGDAVAGAHIVLERTTGAYTPVVIEAWTALDGTFCVNDVPVGEYALRVDAPGCQPHETQITLEAGPRTLELALQPDLGGVSVSGALVDAWTGKAVSGATVRAAHTSQGETIAVLTQTVAGADGRFTLAGIPAGLRRFAGPEGVMRPAGARFVVWVSAEGYLDGFYPVDVGRRGAANLRALLWPALPVLEEREPNNTLAEAQPTPPTTTLRTHIKQPADRDVFRLTLPVDGELQVHIEGVPISLELFLFETRRGQQVARTAQHPNVTYDWRVDLRAGEYALRVEAWGRQQSSPAPFELPIAFRPAIDAHEPNDNTAVAAGELLGARWHGFLFTHGEVDYQRFRAARAGSGQLTVSALPIGMEAFVLDDEEAVHGRQAVHPKNALVCPFRFDAATAFYTRLEHWGRTHYTLAPYEGGLDYVPGDAGEEGRRNETLEQAVPIEPAGIVSGTLNPIGDRDWHRLEVSEAGVLHVRVSAIPIGVALCVTDAAGAVVGQHAVHPNQVNELKVSLRQRGTYHVECEHWGRQMWSASPYLLRTAFYPNDLRDRRDNGEARRATPITPATDLIGDIGFVGDRDYYQVHFPRRGVWRVEMKPTSLGLEASIWDPNGERIARHVVHPKQNLRLDGHIKAIGWQTLQIEHWGNQAWARDPYRVEQTIWLEDPYEPNDAQGEATQLVLNTAVSGSLLPIGDQDFHRVYVPRPGRYQLNITPLPIGMQAFVLDALGTVVKRHAVHPNQPLHLEFTTEAPGHYWVRLEHWGRNDWSPVHYVLRVQSADTPVATPEARLEVRQSSQSHRQVTFVPEAASVDNPVSACEIDFDGDGQFDWRSGTPDIVTHTYERGGWITAMLRVTAANGAQAYDYAIFNTRDLSDEQQLQVEFIKPAPQAVLDAPFDVEVLAWRPDGGSTGSVRLEIDGEPVTRWVTEPYATTLRPDSWAGRTVTLAAVVDGSAGARAEIPLTMAPLVNLLPPNDALLTSPQVTFQWDTPDETSSDVEVTGPDGDVHTFTGEAGTRHVVSAEGLEQDREYTWVARSGDLASAPRRFRLVRGIEFVERAYQFQIERDYDQQRAIRVVNQSEAPETLKLHVDSAQDTLLAGFVGEGSPDKVIELEPGEHREVLLVFAAQDALAEHFRFPITLESVGSAGGDVHTDVAEVAVDVRMPDVKFALTPLGQDPGTLVYEIELHNQGDKVTDFTARLDEAVRDQAYIAPTVEHVSLERGGRLRFQVVPVLSEAFTGFDATLTVRGVHVQQELPLSFQLPEGRRVFLATVDVTTESKSDAWYCTNKPSIGSRVTLTALGRPRRPPVPGLTGPLSASRDPAHIKYMYDELRDIIKHLRLNPKIENAMLAILDTFIWEEDGVYRGDPRAALDAIRSMLREAAFSELSQRERFLAQTKNTNGLRQVLDTLRCPDMRYWGSVGGSIAASLGDFVQVDQARAAEIQRLVGDWEDVARTIKQEMMNIGSTRAIQSTDDLARHHQHLTNIAQRAESLAQRALSSLPHDSRLCREVLDYHARIKSRLYRTKSLVEKIDAYKKKFEQFRRGASGPDALTRGRVPLGPKWLARLDKIGTGLTCLSFVTGLIDRYEQLSQRESISEAEAWIVAGLQAATYTAVTSNPTGAVIDLATTAQTLAREHVLGEKGASEQGLDALIDVGFDWALYGTKLLREDQGAATAVTMRRLSDLLDRINERLATSTDEAEQEHYRKMRDYVQRLLQEKEDDP